MLKEDDGFARSWPLLSSASDPTTTETSHQSRQRGGAQINHTRDLVFFFRTAVMVRYADFSTRNHRKKTNKETKKIRKVQNSDVDHADQLLSIGFKFLSIDLKAFVSFYCKARLFWPSRQCDSTHVSYHWLRSKKPTGENKRRHTAGRNFAPVEITISTG